MLPVAAASGNGTDSHRIVLVADPSRPNAAIPAAQMLASGIDVIVQLIPLLAVVADAPFLKSAEALVVEVDPDLPDNVAELGRIVGEIGTIMPVIAAGRHLTTASARRLRSTGAAETISLPLDPLELEEALESARRQVPARQASEPARRGKLLSFCGSVGGAGTTILATQTGCFMAASARVCLIDLNVQSACAAVYLNMAPRIGLVDLVSAGLRMDVALIESVAAEHSSGLRVIAGPADMVPLEMITQDFVRDLLGMAQAAFDVVIVELPSAWTDWSLAALAMSDTIALVTALSVPGIRQAKRQYAVLDGNNLTYKTRLVLNRVPRPLFRTVDLNQSEKILGHKVSFSISNDYPTVSSAIDQGRTLTSVKAGSAVEKDVKAMANMLLAALGVLA